MDITSQSESVKILKIFPYYRRDSLSEYYLEVGCESLTHDEINSVKQECSYILEQAKSPGAEKFLQGIGLPESPVVYRSSLELIVGALDVLSRHSRRRATT